MLASFQNLPSFYLLFAFTIIHWSRRPAKNRVPVMLSGSNRFISTEPPLNHTKLLYTHCLLCSLVVWGNSVEKAMGAFITWMVSGGHEVDIVGGGGLLPKQHMRSSVQALYCSFGLQTLVWSKLLALSGKKLTFKFNLVNTNLNVSPPPPCIHLVSTHMMNPPSASLF